MFEIGSAVRQEGMSTQFERTLMTAEIPKALSIINEAVPTLLVPFCVFILFGVFDKIAAFVSRCFGAKGPATLTFERSRLRESDGSFTIPRPV